MGDQVVVVEPSPEVAAELERLRTQNAEQTRALALAQARADFPKADVSILETFTGTPENLRAMAEKLHAKELEREAALAAHSPAPPAGVPGPGSSTTADEAAAVRYRELRTKVMGRYAEPHEREEFLTLAFAHGWNTHNAERKTAVRGGVA